MHLAQSFGWSLNLFLFAILPGAKQIKLLNTLAPQKEEQIHRQASKKSLSAFFSLKSRTIEPSAAHSSDWKASRLLSSATISRTFSRIKYFFRLSQNQNIPGWVLVWTAEVIYTTTEESAFWTKTTDEALCLGMFSHGLNRLCTIVATILKIRKNKWSFRFM